MREGVIIYKILCAIVSVFSNNCEIVEPEPLDAPVIESFSETVQAKSAVFIELFTKIFANVLLQIDCETGDNVTEGIG